MPLNGFASFAPTALTRLLRLSQLASNPALILMLPLKNDEEGTRNYGRILTQAVESENGFGQKISRLRREWVKLMVETGAQDVSGAISMLEANARQTALAEASIDAACLVASEELAEQLPKLRKLVEEDLKALEKSMEAAGSPWTPGRIPDWKPR